MRLLEEGIGKLILALTLLLFEDALCVFQVHVRPWFYVRFVSKHRAKHGINYQFRLAARAGYVQVFSLFSHGRILHPFVLGEQKHGRGSVCATSKRSALAV